MAAKNNSKFKVGIILVVINIVVISALWIVGEIYIRNQSIALFYYPMSTYSEDYGKILLPNTVITHEAFNPYFKVTYKTNEIGGRGKIEEPKEQNIIFLGDSYTFGIGVPDGSEFVSICKNNLPSNFGIYNFSGGAWGLTIQAKYFNDYYKSFKPSICILNFCGNDPYDCITDPVSFVKNGEIMFRKNENKVRRFYKFLSQTKFQKSAFFRFIIRTAYIDFKKKGQIANQLSDLSNNNSVDEYLFIQTNYSSLLTAFAHYLDDKNIKLILTSVNYLKNDKVISQVEDFPIIYDTVKNLEKDGLITYLNSSKWFEPEIDNFIESPVGHYSVQWNKIFGENISTELINYLN